MKESNFFEKRKDPEFLAKGVEDKALRENKLNLGDYEKVKIKPSVEEESPEDYDMQNIELMASMDSRKGGQLYEMDKTKIEINKINKEIQNFKKNPLEDKNEEMDRFISLMEKEVEEDEKLDNLLKGN